MARPKKTKEEVVNYLLSNGISHNGKCFLSHLRPIKRGYVYVDVDGKKWRAHRLVYEVRVRALNPEEMVLHTCDNRNCINPEHLYAGTALENTRDMLERGRAANQYERNLSFSEREERLRKGRRVSLLT